MSIKEIVGQKEKELENLIFLSLSLAYVAKSEITCSKEDIKDVVNRSFGKEISVNVNKKFNHLCQQK